MATLILNNLGVDSPETAVTSLQDGSASLLGTSSGATVALLRRGDMYDSLLVGPQADGPVFPLRAVLEQAFLPLSERYATQLGVALHERDSIRKHIREASVALDVIASGRLVSVPPPDFPIHERLKQLVDAGASSIDLLPDGFVDNLVVLNQLQAIVVAWSKEVDRIVHVSSTGPGAVLTAEEETVFWSSLDSALSTAQRILSSPVVKISLNILARKRRATGFSIETSASLANARRNTVTVLGLVQGLPLVQLRSAESLPSLKDAAVALLDHFNAKIRSSSFSVDRSLSLIHSMGDDVARSISRILSERRNILALPFDEFTVIIEECCDLFSSWSHGFDTCRQVIREAARVRGETVPPRLRTQISRLYTHLSGIYELRLDHQAIRTLLVDLSSLPSHSAKNVDILDSGYAVFVDDSRSVDHFKISDAEDAKWDGAVSAYRVVKKKVEVSVCSDYEQMTSHASKLDSLAVTMKPFAAVVDRQFMASSIEGALPLVLQLGTNELKILQSRERQMNRRDLNVVVNELPVICIVLTECQQIFDRTTRLVGNIEKIAGSTRMEVMPELCDFANGVAVLQQRVHPTVRFSKWLNHLDLNPHSTPLFRVKKDSQSRRQLYLSIDLNIAFFSVTAHVAKDMGLPLTKRHSEIARRAYDLHPVFSDLRQSLRIYIAVTDGLRELDSVRRERVFPFVYDSLEKGQSLLEKGFTLQWDSDRISLNEYASQLLDHCSLLSNRYQLILENDMGIDGCICALKELCPSFDNERLSDETLLQVKHSFDGISAHRVSLMDLLPAKDVDLYFAKTWNIKLKTELSQLISRTSSGFFDSLESCKISQLQLSLSIVQEASFVHLTCTPTISSAEFFLYSSIGNLFNSFHDVIKNGLLSMELASEDLKIVMDLLNRFCEPEGMPISPNHSDNPFDRIAAEVELLVKSGQKWKSFVKYADVDIDIARHDLHEDAVEDSAFDSLSRLAGVYEEVFALQKTEAYEKPIDSIVTMESGHVSHKILVNLKVLIEQQAIRCASESAELSQSLYKRISEAKNLVTDAASADAVDAILCLQGLKEDVLPTCREELIDLRGRERIFERVGNNVMRSSMYRSRGSESWILCRDLEAHLQSLEDLYDNRSSSCMADKDSLFVKYEDFRRRHQGRVKTLYSDFQNIRGQDCERETYLETEDLLLDLEHQLEQLDSEGSDVERIGKALGMPDCVDKSSTRAILTEVKRLRVGLKRLSHVDERMQSLSKTRYGSMDPEDVEDQLTKFIGEIEGITKQTGIKRDGHGLVGRLNSFLRQHSLLKALHSSPLSPPRERDLLNRLFDDANRKGGLEEVPLFLFWDANLNEHESYLKEFFEIAAGEASICEFLRDVETTWSARKCEFLYRQEVALLHGIPEVIDELEEHMQALETMKASPYAKLFESERAGWETRLAMAHGKLELLTDVQSRWAHLRILFASRAASAGSFAPLGELHDEVSSFSNVHARFASLGVVISNTPGLIEGLEKDLGLDDMLVELKGIVRGLARFLEKQRTQFPRFFFLSDDDLLQVLSVSSTSIEGLQPHISKLFPGIGSFDFSISDDDVSIWKVESNESEVLTFENAIVISQKPVATWLREMQCAIEMCLKRALHLGVDQISPAYTDASAEPDATILLFKALPVQIVVLALRICFTEEVELCLQQSTTADEELRVTKACVERCLSNICSVHECPEGMGMSVRIFSLMRDQLIKELVYQRNLVERLILTDLSSGSSHIWDNELRMHKEGDLSKENPLRVIISCSCAEYEYGWEYMGVGEALVRTSLTSRCFMILSEAMRRGFGGSPFGPAGTGKTETVKAMGRALGRFVAVFNCDESFDSVSVGRILAGACRIGCWVCFDEFNRLSSSSLSSTSGQLTILQDAIKKKEGEVANFYGGDLTVTVTEGVAFFVTMNPTYTGRRELPANLKMLFRPCSMSKPDSQPITEVLLLSERFKFSTLLSKKMVTFFDALRSTLSNQPHYDFGLRSLKSTIVACGFLLANDPLLCKEKSRTLGQEEEIVVRGVGEVLKPKLDADDVDDYERLISVTFSEASLSKNKLSEELSPIVLRMADERSLVCDNSFIEKVMQLYSILQHHSGVMLVGETGSGKSTVWKLLFDAMKEAGYKRRASSGEGSKVNRSSLTVIDAKLLPAKELYGSLDTLTREWTDGLFTSVLRSIAEDRSVEYDRHLPLHWIVFDGDVDPDWIETLNSVLDDNRILTLPSGEQIPLLPNTRILFETDHLRHANPSSVSRCGMVCFGDESFVPPYFLSKVVAILKETAPLFDVPTFINELIGVILHAAEMVVERFPMVMTVSLQSLLRSFLTLFHHCLQGIVSGTSGKLSELDSFSKGKCKEHALSVSTLVRVLLTTAMKTVGSGLPHLDRSELSKIFLRKARGIFEVDEALQGVITPCLSDVMVLPNGDLREYCEVINGFGMEEPERDLASPDVVIPTPTTVRLEHLMCDALNLSSSLVGHTCPIILCGPPGCGKSMILTSALRGIPNISLTTLSFSSETSPANILTSLKGHASISKRPNGTLVLRPKSPGCRVILFCDEVNLEKPDCFDTQKSVALLRSLVHHGGFWHGSSPEWVSIEGVQIVAACNPSDDTGRHQLPPRFLRHCFVIRVEEPNVIDLKIIYGTFVKGLLGKLHHGLASRIDALTVAMVDFFTRNKNRFSPVKSGPKEPHYIYSPRDLSRWTRGMAMLLLGSKPDILSNKGIGTPESIWMDVLSAFCYEARRLFRDRLVTEQDRSFVEAELLDIVRTHLTSGLRSVPEVLYSSWTKRDEEDFPDTRSFSIIDSSEEFRALVYGKLRVFAEDQGLGGTWLSGMGEGKVDDSGTMIDQFAVTDDVLTHLTRIERVLCQPLGHAVLMGAPGTGKKTLARFAAWMLSVEVHQVRSHSTYSEQDFAADLRNILRRASVKNCQVMMIFDESHTMETAFLEMMNSLLACGEVPGLFSGDERARLLEDLRLVSPQSATTEEALYGEFVRRIRHNLHIIFTISLVSPQKWSGGSRRSRALSDLSQRSPALYNRCTVDWIGDWTNETLDAVADLKVEVISGSEKDRITQCAVAIHGVASDVVERVGTVAGVTPRHYLEFIEQLNRIALEKGNKIDEGVDRYKVGLERLKKAGDAVEDLKEALALKAESLRVKESNANSMLQEMVEEQRLAEKSKVEAEQLAEAATDAAETVQIREEEVTVQLAEALPKIEAARSSVGSIRKEYLEELRAMPNPPEAIRLALEAVIMMLDGAPRQPNAQLTWGAIRSRMRSPDFISSIVSFDDGNLTKAARARIHNKFIKNPAFDVDKISYASRVAGPMAEWTLAVLEYLSVKDMVEPLQKEIDTLQEQQAELLDRQEAAVSDVTVFNERIECCRSEYARLVAESERVRQDIAESESNLVRAENMLDSLDREWYRWISDLNILNVAALTLWGDAVFAAAFVAYAGALDHVNRGVLSEAWEKILKKHNIAMSESFSVSEFLTSPEQRGMWSTCGLPTDATSLENYAILRRSARFPLIVDPTRGCGNLLRQVLDVSSKKVDTPDDLPDSSEELRIAVSSFTATGKKSYMRALESAVRFGTAIVLEDSERYDHAVTPLLGQEIFFGNTDSGHRTGGRRFSSPRVAQKAKTAVCPRIVRLGDRDVFLSTNFSMFLATADLESVPRAAITRANVVSFALSPAALGATCVSRSLKILAPEVEQRRSQSLAARVRFEHRKRLLEQKVLSTVNNVEDLGTHLLNGSLLEDLSSLKEEVLVIEQRQKEEESASQEIKDNEERFEPLGKTAVDIFSVIQGLRLLDPIYKFNTELFLDVFESSIRHCVVAENSDETMSVSMCQRTLVGDTLTRIVSSLFPRDRLAFAASLLLVSFRDWGSTKTEDMETSRIRTVRTIWQRAISSVEGTLKGEDSKSDDDILLNAPKALKEAMTGQLEAGDDNSVLSTAATVVLQKCLNEPHLISTALESLACAIPEGGKVMQGTNSGPEEALRNEVSAYVNTNDGKKVPRGMTFRPLLLCARGDACDPATTAVECANDAKVGLMSLAMGSTMMGDVVSESLLKAKRISQDGRRVVVVIKNMHLVSKSAYERIHSEVAREKGTLPYMLIVVTEISTEASRGIVLSLSSFFRLLAFEAPPSFRSNFGLALEKISTMRAKWEVKSSVLAGVGDRMQVLTSWLHASILERALHCPTGFAKEYDFSEADLSAAWDALVSSLGDAKVTANNVAAVAHKLASCVYGSRIEHEGDQEIVHALVDGLFKSNRIVGRREINSVQVTDMDKEGNSVTVPVKTGQWDKFVRGLPVHADAGWCHMPDDTGLVAQTKEGVEVLQKVLTLSKEKFGSGELAEGKEGRNDQTVEGNEIDGVIAMGLGIAEVDNLDELVSDESPFGRFVTRERLFVEDLVLKVKSDIAKLSDKGKESRETTETRKLREEISEIVRSGAREVPSRWRRACALFGEELNIGEFFGKVSESAKLMGAVRSDEQYFDVRGVLRPSALVTALRYEEAVRKGVSPHCVSGVIWGGEGCRVIREGERILCGLRVNGADWDEGNGVFKLSGSMGSCAVERFLLGWGGGNTGEGKRLMSVPVYGRGKTRTPLWSVAIVVDTDCSVSQWRLNGVCFSIR